MFVCAMFFYVLSCHTDHVSLRSSSFMKWFPKIIKSIFQKPSSCPRNKCIEHWRKLPKLTAFLEIFAYLKNSDPVENV